MSKRTHYEVLGIPNAASADAIRKAYQAMALTMHPDRAPNGAHDAFHAVQRAWEVLRDPESRRAYDIFLQGFVLVLMALDLDLIVFSLVGEAAKLQVAVSAEVDLDDMVYDAGKHVYSWPCRCSSHFEIDEASLEKGVDLASCFGCSAHVRVLYQSAE